MPLRWVTLDMVVAIHDEALYYFGGLAGIRDRANRRALFCGAACHELNDSENREGGRGREEGAKAAKNLGVRSRPVTALGLKPPSLGCASSRTSFVFSRELLICAAPTRVETQRGRPISYDLTPDFQCHVPLSSARKPGGITGGIKGSWFS